MCRAPPSRAPAPCCPARNSRRPPTSTGPCMHSASAAARAFWSMTGSSDSTMRRQPPGARIGSTERQLDRQSPEHAGGADLVHPRPADPCPGGRGPLPAVVRRLACGTETWAENCSPAAGRHRPAPGLRTTGPDHRSPQTAEPCPPSQQPTAIGGDRPVQGGDRSGAGVRRSARLRTGRWQRAGRARAAEPTDAGHRSVHPAGRPDQPGRRRRSRRADGRRLRRAGRAHRRRR